MMVTDPVILRKIKALNSMNNNDRNNNADLQCYNQMKVHRQENSVENRKDSQLLSSAGSQKTGRSGAAIVTSGASKSSQQLEVS